MKTKLLFSLCLLFFFVQKKIYAQNHHFILDNNFTSITAAENLSSLNQAIYKMEERLIPKEIGSNIKSKWWRQFSNKVFRLTKGFFWDLPISGMIVDVQYEVFGKGYRFREFGYTENSYHILAPYPYKSGGGFSNRGRRESGRRSGFHEFRMMNIGGIESTRILSNTLTKKWIFSDSIHYKDALLSVRAFNKATYATLLFQGFDGNTDNDVASYLINLNSHYGSNIIQEFKITSKYIKRRSLINFLNPFLGFAFFSGIENYGWLGNPYGKVHWLKLGKIKYLPSFRMGLTPFGDEVYFESFVKIDNPIQPFKTKAARIYFRHGNPAYVKFNGIGIETFNFYNYINKVIIDFNFDLWKQPEMELGDSPNTRNTNGGIGGSYKLNVQSRLWEKPRPAYLSFQIGFKTDGYLEGEALSSGLIFRCGWSYDL